jgi:hypothetical protein
MLDETDERNTPLVEYGTCSSFLSCRDKHVSNAGSPSFGPWCNTVHGRCIDAHAQNVPDNNLVGKVRKNAEQIPEKMNKSWEASAWRIQASKRQHPKLSGK